MTTKTLESKAFVFDLDGTLIDTTPLVIRFWTKLAIERNLDPNEILATSHGRRTIETLEKWMPDIATAEHVHGFETEMARENEGVIVLPGVIDIINSIAKEDWTVNTAGTSIMATSRLSQFNIALPKEMITGDKLINGKPHPEGYLLAAKALGRDPQDCIVFEDAPAGVQAAIAAGMKCVACTTTHSVEELKDAGATIIVERLNSVSIEKQADGTYKTIIQNVTE